MASDYQRFFGFVGGLINDEHKLVGFDRGDCIHSTKPPEGDEWWGKFDLIPRTINNAPISIRWNAIAGTPLDVFYYGLGNWTFESIGKQLNGTIQFDQSTVNNTVLRFYLDIPGYYTGPLQWKVITKDCCDHPYWEGPIIPSGSHIGNALCRKIGAGPDGCVECWGC